MSLDLIYSLIVVGSLYNIRFGSVQGIRCTVYRRLVTMICAFDCFVPLSNIWSVFIYDIIKVFVLY